MLTATVGALEGAQARQRPSRRPDGDARHELIRMYDVGGVLLPRPFKARRLGHFALWHTDLDMARRLYVDVLGFRHTDTVVRDGKPVAVFTSHGTDHHSLAAIHAATAEGVRKAHYENGVLVNQISFQVGTLEEVANATTISRSAG